MQQRLSIPEDYADVSKIRAMIFDFGGTIGFDGAGFAEGFAQVFTDLGYPIDRAGYEELSREAEASLPPEPRDLETWLPSRNRKRMEMLRRLGAPEAEIESLAMRVSQRLLYYTRPYAYPETHFVLRSLKWAGYIVGVISNISPILPRVLDDLNLTPLLDFAVASATFGASKPDPSIFHEGLRLAKVPADAAVYVGDSLQADVQGSAAVGMIPVLIDHGDRFEAPSGVPKIHNLVQLLDWLDVDPWDQPELHDGVRSR